MLLLHLLALAVACALLLTRKAAPPPPLIDASRRFSIGEPVPLASVVAAIQLRDVHARGALIPLTASDGRRRGLRSTPAPVPVKTISWPSPDSTDARRLITSRSLLQSPHTLRLLVSPSLRAVYCPIRNTAAESLGAHLASAEGIPELPHMSAFSIRDRERLLVRADVLRFTFVVHPFVRLLASYYKGVRGKGGIDGENYRSFMGRVRGQLLKSEERELQLVSLQFFLTFLARQGARGMDEEFQSQTQVCRYADIPYDFVGRVERLAEDVSFIDAKLGVRGVDAVRADDYLREARMNVSGAFAPPRFRMKGMKLYGDDLRNFGYSATLF